MQRLVQPRPEPREIEGDRLDVTDLELAEPNVGEFRGVEGGALASLAGCLAGQIIIDAQA